MSATPSASKSPGLTDIAWAAGLVEGEGSIIAYKKLKAAQGYSGKLVVYQKGRWILDKLATLFGGTVSPNRRDDSGDVTHWVWQTHGPRARGLMMSMYPWFSPRRKAAVRKVIHGEDK